LVCQPGCNALAKNKENKTARAIAKELGVKSVVRACRKAEKTTKAKTKPPTWLIRLHDFCFVRDAELTAAFEEIDSGNQRIVDTVDFERILNKAGAPMPENPADWKALLANHGGERKNTVRYNVFLGGRKLLPKKYLMSSFEPKFKRSKKAKKIKVKGWPMPVCTLPPDLVDPDTVVPRHVDVTDAGRFDRDHPPEHPLEDDSAWYMAEPSRTSVRFNIGLRQLDRNTVRDATHVPTLTTGGIVYVPVNPPPDHEPLAVDAAAALPPPSVAAGTPPLAVWQAPVLGDGAQVNLRDSIYKTPLMAACATGDLELVKIIVEAG
jgi:hypothetical protein